MTLILVALVILGVWWLLTPRGKASRGPDKAAPRRRGGPEQAWSRSAEWLDKLEADREAKKRRDADAATKQELRDLEQQEKQEGHHLPDEVASALDRSVSEARRQGRNGTKKPGEKPDA